MPKTSVTPSSYIGELIDQARRETGLDDFGDDTWREGLEVLVCSAGTDSRFTEQGAKAFDAHLRRLLSNRLQIEKWFRDYPEIADEDVHVELFGMGLPRTGSTALSHFIGEDPTVRSLRSWEHTTPCPPPGFSAEADAARIAESQARLELVIQRLPHLRSMFPISATGPVEEHDILGLTFTSLIFLSSQRLDAYAEWLIDCDMEPAYQYERRVLQLLQWRCPPKTWQLKSPTHTLFPSAVEKAFPESRFLMTHRDPSSVLGSVTDLYATLHGPGNVSIDKVAMGAQMLNVWSTAIDRTLSFRSAGREDKFHDIGFKTFQADPIAEVRRLYEWLDRPFTLEGETRMRDWRKNNPRDKHGTHTFDPTDYGLSADLVDAAFVEYRRRFASLLT